MTREHRNGWGREAAEVKATPEACWGSELSEVDSDLVEAGAVERNHEIRGRDCGMRPCTVARRERPTVIDQAVSASHCPQGEGPRIGGEGARRGSGLWAIAPWLGFRRVTCATARMSAHRGFRRVCAINRAGHAATPRGAVPARRARRERRDSTSRLSICKRSVVVRTLGRSSYITRVCRVNYITCDFD